MFAFVKIYQTMLTIANLRFFKLAKRPPMCTILLIKHCWKIIKLPDVYITFARNMIVTTYREIKRMRSRSLRIFKVYVGVFFSAEHRPMNKITSSGPESQLRSRQRAAKMLIAIVVVFAVCYLPVYVLNLTR